MKKAPKQEVMSLVEAAERGDIIATLRAQIREKEGLLRKYREDRGGLIEVARSIAEAVKAVSPYPAHKFKVPEHSSSEIVAVANISDLHVGEVTRPAETGGFGAFNHDIAQARFFSYVDSLIAWVTLNRRSYTIRELRILGIGDYVSGDIHAELKATNEFPLPVQTARSGAMIAEGVRRLAQHFERVVFEGVGADNHGRLQPKPQAKQKATNNMSYLVQALVAAYLSDHKNVKLIQHEDMAPLVDIAGHGVIVTHGDTMKGVLGIPYYGMERAKSREASRRMLSRTAFSYMNIGHWHVPGLISGNIIVNGSLSGTTEFDHSCGRHSDPCQVSYLMHPVHGMFNFTAWRFPVRKDETDAWRK